MNPPRKQTSNGVKYFVYFVILVVAAAVVAGFFMVGSPAQERLRRFDQQRIQHLQSLQWEVVNFWQSKNKLPERLSDLNDSLRGFSVPKDPQTQRDYEYNIKDAQTFELCAIFNKSGNGLDGRYPVREKIPAPVGGLYQADYWQHEAGHACFERKIDKDFFKPKPA